MSELMSIAHCVCRSHGGVSVMCVYACACPVCMHARVHTCALMSSIVRDQKISPCVLSCCYASCIVCVCVIFMNVNVQVGSKVCNKGLVGKHYPADIPWLSVTRFCLCAGI